MERLLIAGIETEAGRHLVRQWAHPAEVFGVPFSAKVPIPAGGIRRLPRTTPASVKLLLQADAITQVIFCGQASGSGWSAAVRETIPCSDTSELQAWSVACAEAGVPFVFISSDVLFEGPWVFHQEGSECLSQAPLAESIRQQEAIVSEREDALIVRTHVCGFAPQSLLTRRLLLGATAPAARQRWYATPIYGSRFARLLGGLTDRRARGIYHLGGGERISHSQLICQLAERFGRAAISADAAGHEADRDSAAPRETSLRSSKARRLLNEGLPTITDFLDDVAADLESGTACELADVSPAAPVKVA